ncbi:MAG: AsmA family protein [Micavibrio sp.]
MKRNLSIVLGLLILLVGAILIGPSFVDWNKYKPQIIEQAKSAAGYDIKIDGDIKLSVLPIPQLKIAGLSVASPRGREENLLTMKQANVSVDVFPLISGNISIDTVRLVSPDIRLEILPDGSNSWMSDKLLADAEAGNSDTAQQDAQKAKKGQDVSLNKLIIEDGRVAFANRQAGGEHLAEQINLAVRADSLSGPFTLDGDLVYGGKKIEIDADTKRISDGNKEIPANLKIRLPESGASAAFDGIVALDPMEIQGKMALSADNLASVLALAGGDAGGSSSTLGQKLSFSGLVTANENMISSQDMDVAFGEAKGKGNLSVTNLKAQNPVGVKADMAFEGNLNLDRLLPAKDKRKAPRVEEQVAKGQKLAGSDAGFIPETLSLPFPVDGTVNIGADGIQFDGKTFQGVALNLSKKGADIDVQARALDIPGKTRAEGTASIRYASTSRSGEKGVTYADPSVTFKAHGTSEQLPTLLRAFAPAQSDNAALEIYRAAQFNLTGRVTPSSVSVTNSTLKLDDTSIGLAASYKPDGAAGRPDVMIDLTTDMVNIDAIQARLNGQKKQAVQKSPAAKMDVKKALEPVRGVNIPANLTFDVSAQKAVMDGQEIGGIRLKGVAAGSSLKLENASVQNFRGAAASLKGTVANLQELSGIDLAFYGNTADAKKLLQSFDMDTSKLPQGFSSAQANIKASGKADSLAFDADIAAMGGSLQAGGNMTGLLGTPSFSNLTIGAKHPNFVKAMQIVNPAFAGGPGLERPFDLYAKAAANGKVYDITDLKTSIGNATFGGGLKVDLAGAKPSVTGTVQAGAIPLDELLGAKTAAGSGGAGGASAASSDGGKWSRATIETGWMHSANLDLALSAQSITYGGWNFTQPKTKIVLKDGNLTVDGLQAGLFGGDAALNAKVNDPADARQPLSIALDTKMNKVALEPLALALSGSRLIRASGDVSMAMNVQTTGLSPHALVSALQGKATLDGTDIVMKGFDLAQIGLAFVDSGKPLDRLQNVVGGAVSGGETRFDTIKGAYDISQGVAIISNMEMDGPAANIKSRGNVNLPQWVIDTVHTITFKQARDAGAFDVAIKGSLSNPGNTFGRGLFNDVLTRRLQSKIQEKAIEKLPGVLGDDLTGKLQGLGILPQRQQQQPAAAPDAGLDAAPNAAPETAPPPAPVAAPPAPAPEAQPQQEPQQQKQPANNPEQVIRGVLDGFLKQQ